ncbi:hypothetical protein J6590_063118 [Homalodisca vitripennis]|nr:hypothetical protein J6590_063118 [Homalodisca vitripennis]
MNMIELVPSHCWRHVSGSQIPADCASRGILPCHLPNHELGGRDPLVTTVSRFWPLNRWTPLSQREGRIEIQHTVLSPPLIGT